MKRILFALFFSVCLTSIGQAQIVDASSSYRWDKVMTIRSSYSELQCRADLETGERIYQIYANTSNRFDNFCLTIGDTDSGIQTIEYLITFCETSNKGDNISVEMADRKTLRMEAAMILGKKYVSLRLSGNAGSANITLTELNKILQKLKEIKSES